MNLKIVTTMGPGGWDLYGRRFVESFRHYWPADVALDVWMHDVDALPTYENVTFRRLEDTASFLKLKAALNNASDGPGLEYSFKAVALANSVEPTLDWLAFLDADTETFYPVDAALLEQLFDPGCHISYLYRKSVAESEGSFVAFNIATQMGASALADFWGLYDSFEFQHYVKKHDNAVLDRLLTLHCAHGLRVKNLAPGTLGLDAFHQSPLGAYMGHYKGADKTTLADPSLAAPARYSVVASVAAHAAHITGRAHFVEVGTWNGTRAIHLANEAFASVADNVHYSGFDTFEDGNDRAVEGDTKPDASAAFVSRRLSIYATVMKRLGKNFTFDLHKGLSADTLPQADLTQATFAYIDGGHSTESVRTDYLHLKHVPYIVFDDIIKEPEDGAPEGPREVFNEITEGNKRLLVTPDGYAGCVQSISLGLIVQEGYSPPPVRMPLQVTPTNSAPEETQFTNIEENTAALNSWLHPVQAHGSTALLVSAGPSLHENLEDLRRRVVQYGDFVFCVKHAVPTLLAAGIHIDFIVVLDPREVNDISTHGVKRADLFSGIEPHQKVLFATMTHTSVRQHLESLGAKLIGWHALTRGAAKANLPAWQQKGMVIGGGSCAATRMQLLAFTLGFRRFRFYGYDLCYPAGTERGPLAQKLTSVYVGDDPTPLLSTGELIAAMQDLSQGAKWFIENQLSVEFIGSGAGPAIWRQACAATNNYKSPPNWWDFSEKLS